MLVSQIQLRPEDTHKNFLQKFLLLAQKVKNDPFLRASSVRVNIHSGVVLFLRKTPQPNRLISLPKIGCVSLA